MERIPVIDLLWKIKDWASKHSTEDYHSSKSTYGYRPKSASRDLKSQPLYLYRKNKQQCSQRVNVKAVDVSISR